MMHPHEILLAEDDESDVFLINRAFKDAGVTYPLHVAGDGQQAIEFLSKRIDDEKAGKFPSLVILDLKMPHRNGLDVLQWIRKSPGLASLPVFIFSSSSRTEDVENSYLLGANAFIVKPPSVAERKEFAAFINAWLKFNQIPMVAKEGFKKAWALHKTKLLPAGGSAGSI